MNRRGFFASLIAAPVAVTLSRVQMRDEHQPIPGFVSWLDIGVRVMDQPYDRITWKPYGPNDWIGLPAPVIGIMASDHGVTLHCVDGCIRHLDGHPGFPETWRVRDLAHSAHY